MFLLTQIRDPHTANWIENMANATNLLEYHGSGAFNLTRYPDWDSIFVDMIDRPRSKIILQAKQIAIEWTNDLDLLAKANEEI